MGPGSRLGCCRTQTSFRQMDAHTIQWHLVTVSILSLSPPPPLSLSLSFIAVEEFHYFEGFDCFIPQKKKFTLGTAMTVGVWGCVGGWVWGGIDSPGHSYWDPEQKPGWVPHGLATCCSGCQERSLGAWTAHVKKGEVRKREKDESKNAETRERGWRRN